MLVTPDVAASFNCATSPKCKLKPAHWVIFNTLHNQEEDGLNYKNTL